MGRRLPTLRAGPTQRAGRVRGAEWTVGLAAAGATIELAIAFNAFVLRPLLTNGDPRGVVRVAVVLSAFALAASLRNRTHALAAPAARDEPDEADPITAHTAPARLHALPPTPSPAPPASTPPLSARRNGLDVRVLGPVGVHGAAGALTAKSVELVVYLACHPDGIHEERIKAALWPAREPRPQTWLNRVSAARKGLGRTPEGVLLLPWFEHHVGRLHASVQTDADALVAARSRAKHQTTTDAAATLGQALELVRGRPFDMAAGYEWAFTELHVAHAERVVVDVAHDLAILTLTLGNWRRALWATDVGLRACPASELLYQDRMQACAASADRRGIESALRDLRRTLAAADSTDVPSRDTVELYEQLNARLLSAPTEPTHGTGRGVAGR